MKKISCRDMSVDCAWVGRADSETELARKVKDHAMRDHREYFNKEMRDKSDREIEDEIKPYIKEE